MKILGISKFLTIGCFIMLYPIISFASFGATDIRLDTGNPAGASSSTDPQVCDAANGYIYVIWIDYRDGADKGVYFNRSSDFGATWQPTDTRIDRAAVGVPIVSASLGCTDNGHLYVAWVEGVTGNVAFNTSSDYGASWLASEKVIDSFNSCCAVIISGHGDGHVYVVWENGPGLTPTDVYFNYSSDFGNTWQPSSYRFNSSKGIGSSGSYLSSMISTNDGHVYAAWSDERFQIMPFARDIFFRSASDYGATLSPGDFNIDHGGAPFGTVDSASPELCATQDGHVYVAWRDNRADGFYDIYFNYSNDYGFVWQSSDSYVGEAGVNLMTSEEMVKIGCTTNGRIYLSWSHLYDFGINRDVYFNRSADYGLTFEPVATRIDMGDLNGESDSTNVVMSSDESGRVYVAWRDARNGGNDVIFTTSSDNGATWLDTPTRVNVGSPLGSGAALDTTIGSDPSGNVYIAWSDTRNGASDIYFNGSATTPGLIPTLSPPIMFLLTLVLLAAIILIGSKFKLSGTSPRPKG